MVVPIVTPIPVFGPINAVTPFTYRDNDTFQTQLRGLRDKVNEFIAQLALIDASMRTDLGLEITDLTNQLNMQLTTINNALNAVLAQAPVALQADITALYASVNTIIATATTDRGNVAGVVVSTGDPRYVRKGSQVLNVVDYGALGDGVTNDSPAILAAYNAALAGDIIYFPTTGGGLWYVMQTGLVITKPNIGLVSDGRDYATQIKGTTPGMTMFTGKAPGVFMRNLMLVGDGATNGVGATITGLDLYGDLNGNVDSTISGNLIGLAVGARVRARNAVFQDLSVTSCLKGIIFEGNDVVYHTGSSALSNRGNTVRNCRFHNIGNAATDAALEFTTTALILHAIISNNFFDSNCVGKHISISGTVTNPAKGFFISDNFHTEINADCYVLDYVQNSIINGFQLRGNTGVGATYGKGFKFTNCTDVDVSNGYLLQIGQHALFGTSNNQLRFTNIKVRANGLDPANVADGFNFDTTNTDIAFNQCVVNTTDGWGFNGSPVASSMVDCDFMYCTLGRFNSLTLVNRSGKGTNRYVEGTFGRYEDNAYQAFDLAAGVAKQVAVVAGGGSFSSFIMEVTYTARDGIGDCYLAKKYSVRSESGVPVVTELTTVGVTSAARMTVTTTANALSGVNVLLTSTSASNGVVSIKAYSGGSANASNPRGVTVTMSAN